VDAECRIKGMAAHEREALRRFFDGALRPGECVDALRRYHLLHPVRPVARGGEVRPLASRSGELPRITFEDRGRTFDLYDYMATNRVAGLLILKDGEVALEAYELGLTPDTLWGSCSMAKSVASTLVGAAVLDGHIRSLEDPLQRYVPALAGGAYEGVSVRQLLGMASGVAWNEAYTDPTSDRRVLLERQLELQPGAIVDHMSRMARRGPPGSSWTYNTGESYLVGALMEAATGVSLADYLSQKLWSRLGMEQAATWWVESPGGMAVAGSGMSATLRDYARFGKFVLDGGRIDGESVTPEGWFAKAGAPQVIGGRKVHYGLMWWVPENPDPVLEGSFQAAGIYGQFLHVNPRERLAVVVLSARSKPSALHRVEFDDDAFFAGVAKALR